MHLDRAILHCHKSLHHYGKKVWLPARVTTNAQSSSSVAGTSTQHICASGRESFFANMTHSIASPDYSVEHDQVVHGEDSSKDEWKNVRGRTDRKRSNSTETYVCVVAWLVRPMRVEEDHGTSIVCLEKVQEIRRHFDDAYRRWEPHVTIIPPFLIPFWDTKASTNKVERDQENHSNEDLSSTRLTSEQIRDPFRTLNALSDRMEAVCGEIRDLHTKASPVRISFDSVNYFGLRKYKTFHLRPNEEGKETQVLQTLQSKLANAMPEVYEFSRNAKQRQAPHDQSYTPHLTLGQAGNDKKEYELLHAIDALDPVRTPDKRLHRRLRSPLNVPLNAIQLLFKPTHRSGPYDVYREFPLTSM